MEPEQSLIPLGEGSTDRDVVGGKAAVLGLLAGVGYAVPPGFVVTAGAFDRLGDGLDEALAAAADRLGPGPFAVRSSAAAEDLPDASYAGLYETYLNVDRDAIGEAVHRCFASAVQHRVRAYQAARMPRSGELGQQVGLGSSGMAVLVQQMVTADVAGVGFTANPVTGQRDEIVVTAVRGLGERLVSGEAIGQEWVIREQQATCTRQGRKRCPERRAGLGGRRAGTQHRNTVRGPTGHRVGHRPASAAVSASGQGDDRAAGPGRVDAAWGWTVDTQLSAR